MKKQMDMSWIDKAACKGKQDLFYGPDNERTRAKGIREAKAKLVCFTCPVLDQCQDHAMNNPEYGVWGGMTEEERFHLGAHIPDPATRRRIAKQIRSNNGVYRTNYGKQNNS